jgi:hypothetical protein
MKRLSAGLGVVIGVLLLASACSSGHHTARPTTTTTTTPNPDVVPAVITPAYVNAVFKVLNHVYGNATRSLFSTGSVNGSVQSDLRAIFNLPLLTQELQNATASLTSSRSNLRSPIGDIVTNVRELIAASPSCIFVATTSDFGAVLINKGPPTGSEYWALKPKAPGSDPSNLNPTPWALAFNADYLTPRSIPNQCAG